MEDKIDPDIAESSETMSIKHQKNLAFFSCG